VIVYIIVVVLYINDCGSLIVELIIIVLLLNVCGSLIVHCWDNCDCVVIECLWITDCLHNWSCVIRQQCCQTTSKHLSADFMLANKTVSQFFYDTLADFYWQISLTKCLTNHSTASPIMAYNQLRTVEHVLSINQNTALPILAYNQRRTIEHVLFDQEKLADLAWHITDKSLPSIGRYTSSSVSLALYWGSQLNTDILLYLFCLVHSCSMCQKSFAKHCWLARHMRVAHSNSDVIGFCCPRDTCDRVYVDSRNVKSHVASHHDDQSFTCTVATCNKSFMTQVRWLNH